MFQRATRVKSFIRLGLCGPSGSGKTYSALLIAQGLGKKIAVLDTERHSAHLYSHLCEYDVADLGPPYSPERYIHVIKEAEKEGYDVLIIDSLSHAWSGEGGILEMHDKASASARNSFAAWRDVTPKHNALVDTILGANLHIIVCMRTKTAYEVIDDNGKKVPKKIGVAPVQREGMDYEFTVVFDLSVGAHVANSTKDRTSLFDSRYFVPTIETGKIIKNWLESGAEPDPFFESTRTDTLPGKENTESKGNGNGDKNMKPFKEEILAIRNRIDMASSVKELSVIWDEFKTFIKSLPTKEQDSLKSGITMKKGLLEEPKPVNEEPLPEDLPEPLPEDLPEEPTKESEEIPYKWTEEDSKETAKLEGKSVTVLREMLSPKVKEHCGNKITEIKEFLYKHTGKEFISRLTKHELIKVLVMMKAWEKENEAQAGDDDTQKDGKEKKQELILNIHKVLSSISPDGLKRAELLEEKILAPLNWKVKELNDLTITKLEQVYKDSITYVSEHSVDVRKPKGEMTVTKETGVTVQEEDFLSLEDIEEVDDKPLSLTGQPLIRIKKEIEIQMQRHFPTNAAMNKYLDDWTFGKNVMDMSEENAIRVYKGIFAEMKQLDKQKAREVK